MSNLTPEQLADMVAQMPEEDQERFASRSIDHQLGLVDDEPETEPTATDDGAQERWARNARERASATPEPTQHKPRGATPAASDRVAEEREKLIANRGKGASWAGYLQAKFDEAMGA